MNTRGFGYPVQALTGAPRCAALMRVPFGLVERREGVHVAELGPRDRDHLRRRCDAKRTSLRMLCLATMLLHACNGKRVDL